MNREQKVAFRKERAKNRRQRRLDIYNRRQRVSEKYGIPLSSVNKEGDTPGFWQDPSSPTGFSQKCSYVGTCQYPCNGDC